MAYYILANSKYGKEVVDEAKDLVEAEYLVAEYQLAYGSEYIVWYQEI